MKRLSMSFEFEDEIWGLEEDEIDEEGSIYELRDSEETSVDVEVERWTLRFGSSLEVFDLEMLSLALE